MTYSIFAESGNIINWFEDRGAAFEFLAQAGRDEPELAGDIFMMMDKGDPEWPDGFVTAAELLAVVKRG